MHRCKQDGVEWLEFDLLADQPGLCHGVFLKHGGVSEGPYKSLNVGLSAGDNPSHANANLDKICRILNIPAIRRPRLLHTDLIREVNAATPQSFPECDALVTDHSDIGLLITHADCQAAVFYDPVTKAIANVHAGWRGNVCNIYAKTVDYLKARYGVNPHDLLLGVGPSLGPDNAQFVNYQTELPEAFWDYQVKPQYFDLWAISEMQLKESGVLPHHIEIARICTYANPDDYFSYRREKISGRHATIISLSIES